MFVINRHGDKESFDFSKTRQKLIDIKEKYNLSKVNIDILTQNIISSIVDGIKTSKIDDLSASISYNYGTREPEYQIMSFGIKLDNLIKQTESKTLNPKEWYLSKIKGFVRDEVYNKISNFPFNIQENDWKLNYIGLDKLLDIYLLKGDVDNSQVWERPQHLLIRVACELYNTIEEQQSCYRMMADNVIIHSSPTLFNAGIEKPQMASCFLLKMSDTVDSIADIKSECLKVSARAGGLGLAVTPIRSIGSNINSINGSAVGLMSILESLNKDLTLFPQGGKRSASCAVFNELHHPEIESFIMAKNENSTSEAKELFYGLWVSDEFMERITSNSEWFLVNDIDSNLCEKYGDDFKTSYLSMIDNKKYKKSINARSLWSEILEEQCGARDAMYLCFKDTSNKLSNIKNMGTILSSNLCCEIMEPANETETAVCNLVSVSLPACVKKNVFSFNILEKAIRQCVRNVNRTIDIGFYVNEKCETSNKKYRPMGIGMQGLHDMFVDLNINFDSIQAKILMHKISEAMYYYSLDESCELAKLNGKHDDFENTELGKGIFHHELYSKYYDIKYELTQDWESLRSKILEHGVRNGLFIALMPTASSSELLGNSPSFEPYTSLIYKRRIKGKEYVVIIDRLYKRLSERNLWTNKTVAYIEKTGTLPPDAPEDLKLLFKTAYELDWNVNLDMSIIRAPFVDQSQSLNHFIDGAILTPKILNRLYKKAFKNGLKTGSYYIHKNTINVEACRMCAL